MGLLAGLDESVKRARDAAQLVLSTVKSADEIMFTAAALLLLVIKQTGKSEDEVLSLLRDVIALIKKQAQELS